MWTVQDNYIFYPEASAIKLPKQIRTISKEYVC